MSEPVGHYFGTDGIERRWAWWNGELVHEERMPEVDTPNLKMTNNWWGQTVRAEDADKAERARLAALSEG